MLTSLYETSRSFWKKHRLKNSESKYKMRPVLDFLTAELCNGGLFDKTFLPIYTYKLPLQLIPQPHVLQDSKSRQTSFPFKQIQNTTLSETFMSIISELSIIICCGSILAFVQYLFSFCFMVCWFMIACIKK